MGKAWEEIEKEFGQLKTENKTAWKWTKIGLAAAAGIGLFATSLYTVGADEEGVVQRFGKHVRSTKSGIHIKAPWPIEQVTPPKVTEIKKEEFGFRTLKADKRTEYDEKTDFSEESHMLTGDENIVELDFIVQYRIKDAPAYLFNVRDPVGTLRDASEAAMRQSVGDRGIDEALTTGKEEIQQEAASLIQKIMDDYGAGIHVVTVKLQDVNPPAGKVREAFHGVNNAKQAKTTMVNDAWANYNKIIPEARGEADKMIKEAEAYKVDRVNRATGDAKRFLSIWEEYQKAPDVTKKRMYLEAMEKILPGVKHVIVVDEEAEGVLKFLDLGGKEK